MFPNYLSVKMGSKNIKIDINSPSTLLRSLFLMKPSKYTTIYFRFTILWIFNVEVITSKHIINIPLPYPTASPF